MKKLLMQITIHRDVTTRKDKKIVVVAKKGAICRLIANHMDVIILSYKGETFSIQTKDTDYDIRSNM